ncbi:Aste57867_12413 [Aphanomyces stellatus]|uniref:Aste57867_12413 protein n=1 Tax=Aphanomyces stellatus TaxID=120398 RepID=A0A485KVJ7_9STRA|nr:hypothetical protein As57867_012367 [Aphanomyces stellatus]VFT89264.1 Aste57867_12413 [Aphanomyces stellatus]
MANPSDVPYIQDVLDEVADRRTTKRRLFLHLVFIVFLLLNIIALYLLVFLTTSSTTKLSSFSSNSPTSINSKAVSFAADGSVRAGAGTSAYLDVAPMPSDSIGYFYVAPSGLADSNTVLATYYLTNQTTSVLTTVSVALDSNAASLKPPSQANTVAKAQFQGVVTLNDNQAIVLQSVSGNISAVAVAINSDKSVTLLPNKVASIVNASFSNSIGRVSATQFATTSYDPYVSATTPFYQNIRVGTVASDGSISLSSPLRFGLPNTATDSITISRPTALPAVPNGFLVTYYNANNLNASGLCVVLVTSNATAGASILNQLCNTKYQPAYFVDSTPLADNTVVFAFHDKNNNYALTLATLQVTSSGQLAFRGDYVLRAVAGPFDFGTFYSWYPKPIVRALNGGTNLALLFLNPANAGRPTTQVLQATSSFAWSPVTPLLPLSDTGFTLVGATAKAMTATVTLDLVPLSTTSFLAVYAGQLNQVNQKRVSVVEFLGKPVGIATSNGKDIILSGKAKVSDANLNVGKVYLTTTKGDIVAGEATSGDFYTVGSSTFVSADSRVGLAVSSDSIFLS